MFRNKTFQYLTKSLSILSAAVLLINSSSPPVMSLDAQEILEEKLEQTWDNLETTVSVSSLRMSFDDVCDIYYNLLYTSPERFYLYSGFQYTVQKNSDTVGSVMVKYTYDVDEIPEMIEVFNDKVDAIVADCRAEWTDAAKLLYLHDYLCSHVMYDETGNSADAYSALVTGHAICQGYSMAMSVLCHKVGIESYPVSSREQNHMWNVVKLDGEWYYLDSTYDDPVPNILGQATHTFFLRGQNSMSVSDGHKANDWHIYTRGEEIHCSANDYDDTFWGDAMDSAEPLADGSFIMAMQNDPDKVVTSEDVGATILRLRLQEDGTFVQEPLTSLKAVWLTPENYVYINSYVYTTILNDKLYYCTADSIYEMGLDGTNQKLLHQLTASEKKLGNIFGFEISGQNILTYGLMKVPEYTGTADNITYRSITLENTAPVTTTTTSVTTTTSTTSKKTTTTTATTTRRTRLTTTTTSTTQKRTTTTTTTTTTSTTKKPTTTTTTSTTTTTKKPTTTTTATTTTTTTKKPTTTTTTTTSATTTTTSTTQKPTTTMTTTTTTVSTTKKPTTTKTTVTTTAATTTVTTTVSMTTTKKMTTTVSTVTTTTVEMKVTLLGDVDDDGQVNVSDVILLCRYATEDPLVMVTAQGIMNADCNRDGFMNAADASTLLLMIAKLI